MDPAPTESQEKSDTETKCVGCRHPFCPVAIRDLARTTAADLKFWKKNQNENERGSGAGGNRKNTDQVILVVEGRADEKTVAGEPAVEE
jgi:hypothetical protein